MHIKSLSLINFKNYRQAEFQFDAGVNCFVGKNGSGKTNILDAIHYLSMCKSYLNPVDKQNIRFGEHFFVIQGNWELDDSEQEVYCGVKAGHKKIIKKNKLEYERLADHIGLFPSVMISPYDRDLIAEGSEVRRKWMDGIISQFDRSYLDLLVRYGKILDQRNALLKQFYENGFFQRESMEIWDEQLVPVGEEIFRKRKEFLTGFLPVFNEYYNFIGEAEEQVEIEYKSQLNDSPFADLLEMNRRKDAQSLYTNGGTHKDDLLFTIKSNPIKKFGSQGQQKSFIIALRLAQFDWLTKQLNKKPVLMLDDIFDKLDSGRVEKLISLVSQNIFGQVLITDTDVDRIRQLFEAVNVQYNLFEVEQLNPTEEIYG
ncbi:MAG: replication and repair protein RecF [Crocinitomicaceae bacterium]|jgi:DNA replication and repair protein RecF|nr:replication and repair protein RecF [Crocinitomicaceae bacterium]